MTHNLNHSATQTRQCTTQPKREGHQVGQGHAKGQPLVTSSHAACTSEPAAQRQSAVLRAAVALHTCTQTASFILKHTMWPVGTACWIGIRNAHSVYGTWSSHPYAAG
jgi:hypothetical protein